MWLYGAMFSEELKTKAAKKAMLAICLPFGTFVLLYRFIVKPFFGFWFGEYLDQVRAKQEQEELEMFRSMFANDDELEDAMNDDSDYLSIREILDQYEEYQENRRKAQNN